MPTRLWVSCRAFLITVSVRSNLSWSPDLPPAKSTPIMTDVQSVSSLGYVNLCIYNALTVESIEMGGSVNGCCNNCTWQDFLRSLPNCLLTCELYNQWTDVTAVIDTSKQIDQIRRSVHYHQHHQHYYYYYYNIARTNSSKLESEALV